MKEYEIRKLDKTEIDNIMKIWYEANIEVHSFVDYKHWKDIFDRVRSKLENKENIYVYREDDIIKGFICMDEENYISELYVDKEYRSCGIGSILINYLKENNYELSLHVFKKNEKAVKFYLRQGFNIVNEELEEETNEMGYFMKWEKKI